MLQNKPIHGNSRFDQIHHILTSSTAHRTLLIHGNQGMGKRSMVEESITQQLTKLDQQKDGKNTHLFKNKNHPDILIIEAKSDEQQIDIEDARTILNFMSLKPALMQKKYIIIDAAEQLNNNAANCLLKALEEPNQNTTFILISHNKYCVSDTLLSRCLTVNLSPLNDGEFSLIANQIGTIDLEYQMICNNNIGLALHMQSLEAKIPYYELLHNLNTPILNLDSSLHKNLEPPILIYQIFIERMFTLFINAIRNKQTPHTTEENNLITQYMHHNLPNEEILIKKIETSLQLMHKCKTLNLDPYQTLFSIMLILRK